VLHPRSGAIRDEDTRELVGGAVARRAEGDVIAPARAPPAPQGSSPGHQVFPARGRADSISWMLIWRGARHGQGGRGEAFGSWWMAAQSFIRWSRLGVWERLLAMAQERGVGLGMAFLDGTSVRAHHKAAEATKRRRTGAARYA
jgi:transposase